MIDDIYVINLKKDIERLSNIKKNFDKYGLSYTKFDAVYGKDMSQKEIDSKTTVICRTLMCNKGIVGSAMSHYGVWNIVSKKKDGWYMICEDDINFRDESIDNIKQIQTQFEGRQKDPVFISLNSCNSYSYNDNSKLVLKTEFVCGISCYIVTPETCRRLVNFINKKKINQYLDIQMSFCRCGIEYYITPRPVVFDSAYGGYLTSNNAGYGMSLPLLQFLIMILLPNNWSSIINFRINIVLFCLFMKYCMSIGIMLLVLLFLANILFIKSPWIINYIAIEVLLLFLFMITKK
jgi:GR25 family glycosyltransferase involved in LPS biosynthesis